MVGFTLTEESAAEGGYHGEDVVVVVVTGELDYAASPQFRQLVLEHVRAGRRGVVIELSRVSFIDSTAIGVLVAAATRLRDGGEGRLLVVCAADNERVLRIFDIAGLASLIPLFASRAQAIAALAESKPDLRPERRFARTAEQQGHGSPPGPADGAGAARRYSEDAARRERGAVTNVDGEGRARGVDELA